LEISENQNSSDFSLIDGNSLLRRCEAFRRGHVACLKLLLSAGQTPVVNLFSF
jgi:hypothetical protein